MTDAVGVLGATSLVGECLLPMLMQSATPIIAYTRQPVQPIEDVVCWEQLKPATSAPPAQVPAQAIPLWICAAPIWVLPDYFDLLIRHGVRRFVVLSSTSRFTKGDAADSKEREVAHRLADAEDRVRIWAESHAVEWVILRPTLIYGLGRDKNIAEIARFIRRFGFFPVFGEANGLRQPLHVADLAAACLLALRASSVSNRPYNISGGETLTYREMVKRVFLALDRSPRLITVPLWIFSTAVFLLKQLPRYQKWSSGMAARMNKDMIFEHDDAVRDFGFSPRNFLNSNNVADD